MNHLIMMMNKKESLFWYSFTGYSLSERYIFFIFEVSQNMTISEKCLAAPQKIDNNDYAVVKVTKQVEVNRQLLGATSFLQYKTRNSPQLPAPCWLPSVRQIWQLQKQNPLFLFHGLQILLLTYIDLARLKLLVAPLK